MISGYAALLIEHAADIPRLQRAAKARSFVTRQYIQPVTLLVMRKRCELREFLTDVLVFSPTDTASTLYMITRMEKITYSGKSWGRPEPEGAENKSEPL